MSPSALQIVNDGIGMLASSGVLEITGSTYSGSFHSNGLGFFDPTGEYVRMWLTPTYQTYYDSNRNALLRIEPSGVSMFANTVVCGSTSVYHAGVVLSVRGSGAVMDNFNVYGSFYAASGSIAGSDRNIKKDIAGLNAEEALRFIMDLNPVMYKYIDGTSDRYHQGFIAQDVKEAMQGDWGLYCEVTQPAQIKTITNEASGEAKESVIIEESKTIASLRYEELISPMVKVIQSQQKEIDKLKATLKKVMAFINYEEAN